MKTRVLLLRPIKRFLTDLRAGWKPSITLEELGSSYDVKKISLSDNEQKQEWFLKINPNGRYTFFLLLPAF